ncbi:MAG TPA: bifunctional riboflavin kinase/FAD synthetase [Acidimicrobiales bacterium]|nr:bifunctional riboflavin kinase/FAD synthetase [Acidimicrobiales bacterium]
MRVVTDLAACSPSQAGPPHATVVTIGAYDGVHVGHRAILTRVRAMAEELNCATAVVTFDRHPATVVRPDSAPGLLTDLDQKLELLAAAGVDECVVVHFDEARSRQSAEEFVKEVIVGCLGARAVVVGHDFHFGHARGGNVPLLQRMGAEMGFDVLGVSLAADDATSEAVSSTRVRALLAAGDVKLASCLLGRQHEVRGTVVRGDARGHELGYRTANVTVPEEILLPADGIYAGWYERPSGEVHATAISLGRRPTFYPEASASVLEAHLLDFDDRLYGEAAKVRFAQRLRGEERFGSERELVEQMGHDVRAVREVLG